MLAVSLLLFGCPSRECTKQPLTDFCGGEHPEQHRDPPCPTLTDVKEIYCHLDLDTGPRDTAGKSCLVEKNGSCIVIRVGDAGERYTFSEDGKLVRFVYASADRTCPQGEGYDDKPMLSTFNRDYGNDSVCFK